MNWLDKLEKKIRSLCNSKSYGVSAGRVCDRFRYLLFSTGSFRRWLTLEPSYILHGQIWRIISWVLIPPTGSLISLLFMVLFYYHLGTALEVPGEHSGIMSIFSWNDFYRDRCIYSVRCFLSNECICNFADACTGGTVILLDCDRDFPQTILICPFFLHLP